MKIIVLALVAIADGLFLHQWNRVLNKIRTSHTIKRLCRYAVGVLGAWPIFLMFLREQRNGHKDNNNVRELIAYVLSFVFVGIGVFIGYVIDSFIH